MKRNDERPGVIKKGEPRSPVLPQPITGLFVFPGEMSTSWDPETMFGPPAILWVPSSLGRLCPTDDCLYWLKAKQSGQIPNPRGSGLGKSNPAFSEPPETGVVWFPFYSNQCGASREFASSSGCQFANFYNRLHSITETLHSGQKLPLSLQNRAHQSDQLPCFPLLLRRCILCK